MLLEFAQAHEGPDGQPHTELGSPAHSSTAEVLQSEERGGHIGLPGESLTAVRQHALHAQGQDMAAGEITTLPLVPEDGGSSGFLPGTFKELKRLYCKNGGYFLRINSDGRVDGTREKNDVHIKLQIQATAIGEVVIKGVSASRYLAMNDDGRLFGTKRATDDCYFFERLESNNYNTYRSRKHPSWYVALTRTGQHKLGSKTGPGQKAVLFLPMSAVS